MILQQQLDIKGGKGQVIILSPTTALAKHNEQIFLDLGSHLKVQCHTCADGNSVNTDIASLRKGQQIVFGTPGTVLNLIQSTDLLVSSKMLVLIDAEQMLTAHFTDQINGILLHMSSKPQVIILSAVISDEFLKMSADPVKIFDRLSLEGVRHFVIRLKEEHKYETLLDLYETCTIINAVIFCNSDKNVTCLSEKMFNGNFRPITVLSDTSYAERKQIMDKFHRGEHRLVIASNICARGLSVQPASVVFNFDVPYNKELYIHTLSPSRCYRNKIVAINFVTEKDMCKVDDIEKEFSTSIPELPSDVANLI